MNEFFEKIFVINLKRRPDRREEVSKMMAGMGIRFEFIEAVDGGEMLPTEEARLNYYLNHFIDERETHGWVASVGQIGCWLSHVELWKKIVEEHIDSALILEDDLSFNKYEEFSDYMKETPEDWNVLMPGYCGGAVTKKINDKIVLLDCPSCTHAYAVKRDAARVLLNNHYPMQGALDSYTGNIFWTRERNAHAPGRFDYQFGAKEGDKYPFQRSKRNPDFRLDDIDKIKSYAFSSALINQNGQMGSDV